MYQNNIPSIPVVDKEGKIITSLSASDVRGLTKEKMRSLLLPVEEYLFQIHGERPNDPSINFFFFKKNNSTFLK